MKKAIGIILLLAMAGTVQAAPTALAVDLQDVNVTGQNGAINVISTATTISGTVTVQSSEDAANVVSTYTVINTGAGAIQVTSTNTAVTGTVTAELDTTNGAINVISTATTISGTVQVAIDNGLGAMNVVSTSTQLNDGTDALDINADGSINSSATIRGSGGFITSETSGGEHALHVLDINKPDIAGKSAIHFSSMSHTVGEGVAVTGLVKHINFAASNTECVWSIGGTVVMSLFKNTGDTLIYDYTLDSPTITLDSKSVPAGTCRMYGTGAN